MRSAPPRLYLCLLINLVMHKMAAALLKPIIMKYNLIPFFAMLLVFSLSCRDKKPGAEKEKVSTEKPGTNLPHEEEHMATAPVTLLNGQKWKANPETTAGIRNMKDLLEKFPAAPKLEDYHMLRVSLEKELNQILEKCTMQGEAHTQLHNYLLPMRENFEKLGAANPEECRAGLESLQKHLEEYQDYFE